MCLAQGPQHRDAGESSSVPLSQCAPSVIIAKENPINAHELKNSYCIIENLPFDCKFATMKEVVDGILYKDFSKKPLLRFLDLFLSRACNTDPYLFPTLK